MRKYFIYLLALFAIVACSEIEEYGNDDGRSGNIGANKELFFQAAGWRYNGTSAMSNTGVAALYWTSTPSGTTQAYSLGIQNNNIKLDAYTLRKMGAPIRCVKR